MDTLGRRVRELREERGISQTALTRLAAAPAPPDPTAIGAALESAGVIATILRTGPADELAPIAVELGMTVAVDLDARTARLAFRAPYAFFA